MPLAELMVVPVSGVPMKPVVDRAIEAIKHSGVKYEVGALATTLEGSLEQIFDAASKVHQAAMAQAKDRVITELRIDERADGNCSIEHDTRSYR